MLSLRRTDLSSPAYRGTQDYIIVENGREIGPLHEDRARR